MNAVPRLSIGLPVYNGENYLAESLDALLGQSYEDFELIISDNASTDGTGDICRRYGKQDSRIRYIRQPRNIGLSPNHNFVFRRSRGELFKWAAADDLYARDLLQRSVNALDEYREVVLAHSWTAAIDSSGNVTQSLEYPLATDSPRAPERFRSFLFGSSGLFESRGADGHRVIGTEDYGVIRACDQYGVIRADILRRVAPLDSYHHADMILVGEIALHGPFHQTPDWLYFRRDHPDRAYCAHPTVRARCANMDPCRASRLRHPTARLLAEYIWGYIAAIRRAPLSPADRRECYGHLAQWMLNRAASRALPRRLGRTDDQLSDVLDHHAVSIHAIVARPGEEVVLTSLRQARRRTRATAGAPRVGLFGLFGQGNIGNDGSLQAMLAYLRAEHPDVILDVLCSGPEQVTARYGVPAACMHWYQLKSKRQGTSGLMALAVKCMGVGLGIGIDTFRAASWIRRHDVVIVPGMGVLEATIVLRPWYTPYSMFLLSASGRLFGTKVALVSVGANVIRQRLTRWLFMAAARLAHYRSFRDDVSRDAMRQMGLDTSSDAVYPDLTFSLPTACSDQRAAGTVGLGIMDYSGGNDDRRQADEIRSCYIEKMTNFALWLVDNGRSIRLFTGDTADERVVRQILANLQAHRPELGPLQVIAEPVSSLDELMRQMASVNAVVATRYHNVVCALKLAKPTLSLGYSAKHDVLMTDMGLSGFCQPVKSLDVVRLIAQFRELESRSAQLRLTMTERSAAKAQLVNHQFAELSAALFPTARAARTAAGHKAPRTGAR